MSNVSFYTPIFIYKTDLRNRRSTSINISAISNLDAIFLAVSLNKVTLNYIFSLILLNPFRHSINILFFELELIETADIAKFIRLIGHIYTNQ